MLNGLKKLIKGNKTPAVKPADAQKQIARYWFNCIRRAEKIRPVKNWETAEDRYKAKPKKDGVDVRPFVNDYRKLHEASMAFLDQQEPSFKISPSEAFMSDEIAQMQAECEAKYLKKVWKEQKCQRVESRRLNEALIKNNGFVITQFDTKKWMPTLRYIHVEKVAVDPDCEGVMDDANWQGYEEDVSVEEFRSLHSDMPEPVFKSIVKKAGSVLAEEERDGLNNKEDVPLYQTIKIWHIFARNSAAIRKPSDGEEDKVDKRLAEELQLDTPRRYMQFASGYEAPLTDEDRWPLDLDHDEFPLSHLQFNIVPKDFYGFNDYQQMQRLDELSDDVIKYLGIASFWAAVTKFAGSGNMKVEDVQITNFLNDANTSFLNDMLDPEGNPKLKALDRGRIEPAQMQMYELVHDQAHEASGLSELLKSTDVQTYKDVTALAARIADANMHQRVNRRLSGPWGYEQAICEDATKMLEVAHQFVPQLSTVSVMKDFPVVDGMGNELADEIGNPITEQKEDLVELPWPEALKAISEGGQLIKLGIDAIVGPDLAKFWPYRQPPNEWKLSTKVAVEPGTTRSITKEQQAAALKQLYVEVFAPFYQSIGRLDLMREYLELIGRLAALPNLDNLLPEPQEMQQIMQQMALQRQQEAEAEAAGEAGGQPLNSPEANAGEEQS